MIKLTLVLMKSFDKLSTIMMNNYLIKNFLGWNKHCQVNTCLKKTLWRWLKHCQDEHFSWSKTFEDGMMFWLYTDRSPVKLGVKSAVSQGICFCCSSSWVETLSMQLLDLVIKLLQLILSLQAHCTFFRVSSDRS